MNTKLGAVHTYEYEEEGKEGSFLRFFYDNTHIDIEKEEAFARTEKIRIGDMSYLVFNDDTFKEKAMFLYDSINFTSRTFNLYELIESSLGYFKMERFRLQLTVRTNGVSIKTKENEILDVGEKDKAITITNVIDDSITEVGCFADQKEVRYRTSLTSLKRFFGTSDIDKIWTVIKNLIPENEYRVLKILAEAMPLYAGGGAGCLKTAVILMSVKQFDLSLLERMINAGIQKPQRFINMPNRTNYDYSVKILQYRVEFSYDEYLNTNEKKLHKVFKCPKYFLKYLQTYSTIEESVIREINELEKLISSNSLKEILDIIEDESDVVSFLNRLDTFISLLKNYGYTNPKNLALYLAREVKMRQGITSLQTALFQLRDYNRMSVGMNRPREKYPKSLKKDHDLLSMNYKVLLDTKKEELFTAKVAREDYLALNRDIKEEFYSIVTPTKFEDIVSEGEHLSHCIASYINSIIEGKCKIVFLRRSESKDEPLVSIEIRGNNIRQVAGYGNRKPDNYEMAFIKKWAEENNLSVKSY